MITANFLVFYFGRISTASGPFVIVQGLSLYSLAGGSRRQICHRGGLKRGFELFCKRKYSFASRPIASEGGGAGLRRKSLEKTAALPLMGRLGTSMPARDTPPALYLLRSEFQMAGMPPR